jgi:hypothetical protein
MALFRKEDHGRSLKLEDDGGDKPRTVSASEERVSSQVHLHYNKVRAVTVEAPAPSHPGFPAIGDHLAVSHWHPSWEAAGFELQNNVVYAIRCALRPTVAVWLRSTNVGLSDELRILSPDASGVPFTPSSRATFTHTSSCSCSPGS